MGNGIQGKPASQLCRGISAFKSGKAMAEFMKNNPDEKGKENDDDLNDLMGERCSIHNYFHYHGKSINARIEQRKNNGF